MRSSNIVLTLDRALRNLKRLHRISRVLLSADHVRISQAAALFDDSGRDGKALRMVRLSQRMVLQLFEFVPRRHVPKLLASMMIKNCARLLLCANMMDSLLSGRHGHWTHADVATRQLLLLHDGVILLR